LDALTAGLVEAGLAIRSIGTDQLIVRDRAIFWRMSGPRRCDPHSGPVEALETKDTMLKLLEAANKRRAADFHRVGERIVRPCGLFDDHHSLYEQPRAGGRGDRRDRPTRLNYARIIPMVDYTAKVIGRLLG